MRIISTRTNIIITNRLASTVIHNNARRSRFSYLIAGSRHRAPDQDVEKQKSIKCHYSEEVSYARPFGQWKRDVGPDHLLSWNILEHPG